MHLIYSHAVAGFVIRKTCDKHVERGNNTERDTTADKYQNTS